MYCMNRIKPIPILLVCFIVGFFNFNNCNALESDPLEQEFKSIIMHYAYQTHLIDTCLYPTPECKHHNLEHYPKGNMFIDSCNGYECYPQIAFECLTTILNKFLLFEWNNKTTHILESNNWKFADWISLKSSLYKIVSQFPDNIDEYYAILKPFTSKVLTHHNNNKHNILIKAICIWCSMVPAFISKIVIDYKPFTLRLTIASSIFHDIGNALTPIVTMFSFNLPTFLFPWNDIKVLHRIFDFAASNIVQNISIGVTFPMYYHMNEALTNLKNFISNNESYLISQITKRVVIYFVDLAEATFDVLHMLKISTISKHYKRLISRMNANKTSYESYHVVICEYITQILEMNEKLGKTVFEKTGQWLWNDWIELRDAYNGYNGTVTIDVYYNAIWKKIIYLKKVQFDSNIMANVRNNIVDWSDFVGLILTQSLPKIINNGKKAIEKIEKQYIYDDEYILKTAGFEFYCDNVKIYPILSFILIKQCFKTLDAYGINYKSIPYYIFPIVYLKNLADYILNNVALKTVTINWDKYLRFIKNNYINAISELSAKLTNIQVIQYVKLVISLSFFHVKSLTSNNLEFMSIAGRGAYGIVFVVRDSISNNTYAMKLFDSKTDCIHEENMIKQIQSLNMNTIPRIYHQNIRNCEQTRSFLIEFIDGVSLSNLGIQKILMTNNMTLQNFLLRFEKQIIHTRYEMLYKSHFIHGDYSDNNIMMDKNGNLFLIDYGYADNLLQPALISKDNFRGFLGTLSYFSPSFYSLRCMIKQKIPWNISVVAVSAYQGEVYSARLVGLVVAAVLCDNKRDYSHIFCIDGNGKELSNQTKKVLNVLYRTLWKHGRKVKDIWKRGELMNKEGKDAVSEMHRFVYIQCNALMVEVSQQ
eukprot:346992_1